MFLRFRNLLGLLSLTLGGLLSPGCSSPPAGARSSDTDDQDIEARAMESEMLRQRARFEPKGGFAIPTNSKYDTGIGGGVQGQIEVIQKGMWLGFDFDFLRVDTKNPLGVGTTQSQLLAAKTEQLMDNFDRYHFGVTWDYDLPMGSSLYSPIFRLGLGLGGVAFAPTESAGNTLLSIDTGYTVVVNPRIGFRFPFSENAGIFIEGEYDFIPNLQFTGVQRLTDQNVDIGNSVELSSINFWAGFSLQW